MLIYFRQNRRGGFTLIELMIVVAIIAILAAVAIPNFMSARDRARRASTAQALGAMRKAIEMYATDRDVYTDTRSRLLGYTNVTGLEAACSPTAITPTVAGGLSGSAATYLLTAKARSRDNTPCTATQDDVWCVGP